MTVRKRERILESPEFNKDGYPTDRTLEELENWDPMDFHGLVEFMAEAWRWESYREVKKEVANFSTGGWSGNEDLIYAINPIWRMMHFYSHHRGGHYVFTKKGRSPEEIEKENENEEMQPQMERD